MAAKIQKVLSSTKRWTSTMISFVLLMFEQLAFLEFMAAEYMAFEAESVYEYETEKEE